MHASPTPVTLLDQLHNACMLRQHQLLYWTNYVMHACFDNISYCSERFRGFVLPVLAVWCSAADTPLKELDREVNGASFLTGGVIEFNIAHRRSVALL